MPRKPRSDEQKEREREAAARKRAAIRADPEAHAKACADARALYRAKKAQMLPEDYRAMLDKQKADQEAARRAKAEVKRAASPRLLAEKILGSSVSLTDDKEVLGWEWYDMTCPRCPGQRKMVTDKQYVWCNECAYELKGTIA